MECEIILIGNELLIGKIQDTNGMWIIHQLLPFGIKISRILIIPDDLEAIANTIRESINRKPVYIFTSGGLGPTFDDMTLEGIARGLTPPRHCLEDPKAIQMIQDAYSTRFGKPMELTPNRRKMGTIPEGSFPLFNRVGTAPGVLIPPELTNGITNIVCLPGVPSELIAIFSDHILPIFQQKMKNGHFYQAGFTFQDLGESKFTELIYQIKDEYPDIWIKTHPKSKEKSEVELHLTSFSSKPEIPNQIKALYLRLQRHVVQSNGVVVEEHPLLP
jgi:molybdenum cofactor synthesis domain-containing protein